MICATCGCSNPTHLIFCQECGQRLGPRVAPPTPAIGIDASLAAADAASRTGCSRCGAENTPGVRYCMTCGNVLVTAPPAVAPSRCRPLRTPRLSSEHRPPRPRLRRRRRRRSPSRLSRSSPPPLRPRSSSLRPSFPPSSIIPLRPGWSHRWRLPRSPRRPQTRRRARARAAAGDSDGTAQFCRFCGASLGGKEEADVEAPPAPDPNVAVSFAPPSAARLCPRPSPPHPWRATEHRERRLSAPQRRQRFAGSSSSRRRPRGRATPLVDQVDIGRTEGDVIIREDRYLSPRHARLTARALAGKPPEVVLVDLASTNGIYLRLGRDGAREAVLEIKICSW